MATDYSTTFAIIILVSIFLPIALYFLMLLFGLTIVQNKKAVIVERFGKNPRILSPGFHFLFPLVDKIRPLQWRHMVPAIDWYNKPAPVPKQITLYKIDLREAVLDLPTQPIITRDNVEIVIHPMLLYKIHDPMRAVYETCDLSHCIVNLVQTTLRSLIGDMGLDDTLASREEINRSLIESIYHICYNWGLQITSVEVLQISPTDTVQDAMHKQLTAERDRRALIVDAHGFKEKIKFTAEGEYNAEIAKSKGEQVERTTLAQAAAEQRIILAKAQAQAFEIIGKEAHKYGIDTVQYVIALKYLETLKNLAISAKNRELVFPLESDIIGSLSNLAK